jgi:uncharacterized protein (DUF2126 family)
MALNGRHNGGRNARFPIPHISFPRSSLPVHILKAIVSAFFVHPQRFAIISHGLNTNKQALIVHHVLHNLTGTLKDTVASTFVDLLSFQVNFINAILFCDVTQRLV